MFHTEEGINSLRRVLVCYSQKNPEVGYCQAMNIISSLLLTFMGEVRNKWPKLFFKSFFHKIDRNFLDSYYNM